MPRRRLSIGVGTGALVLLFGASCNSVSGQCRTGKLIGPDGEIRLPEWSAEEQAKDVALRTLRQTDAASYHLVRLAGAEKPHTHDRSDLSVFVLSGAVRMHVGTATVSMDPGDVADVPRGVVHWAENAGSAPSLAYVVFAPAFDGKDRRFVDAATPAASPAASAATTSAPAPAAAPSAAPSP